MRATAVALLVALSIAPTLAQQSSQQPNQEVKQSASQSQKPTKGSAAQTAEAQQEGGEYKGPWKGLQYRLVGPYRGGRVVAASGVVGQQDVYYFGAVAGGVWKTTDGGLNWKPMFDKTKDASPSIGAIAVSRVGPERDLCGNRRGLHPRQHRRRQRSLQIDRRRQDLEVHRTAAIRTPSGG